MNNFPLITETESLTFFNGNLLLFVERHVIELTVEGKETETTSETLYNVNGTELFYRNSLGEYEINEREVSKAEYFLHLNSINN